MLVATGQYAPGVSADPYHRRMNHDLDRKALVDERAATLALIETMSARLRSVVEAGADASSDDEHDPEGSTLAFERGQLVA